MRYPTEGSSSPPFYCVSSNYQAGNFFSFLRESEKKLGKESCYSERERERELTKSSFSFFSSHTKRQANFQLPMPYGWWSEPSFFSFFVVSTGEKKCWWSCFFMATNSDQRLHFSKWRFPSFSTPPTFTSRYYTPPNVGQIILLDWKKCAFLKFRGVTCLSFPLPYFCVFQLTRLGRIWVDDIREIVCVWHHLPSSSLPHIFRLAEKQIANICRLVQF